MTNIVDRLKERCWPLDKRDELCMDAVYVITDLRARLAEAERQRDELLDFVETVAQGKRGDCNCWVCELARLAQEAIDAAKAPGSAP